MSARRDGYEGGGTGEGEKQSLTGASGSAASGGFFGRVIGAFRRAASSDKRSYDSVDGGSKGGPDAGSGAGGSGGPRPGGYGTCG